MEIRRIILINRLFVIVVYYSSLWLIKPEFNDSLRENCSQKDLKNQKISLFFLKKISKCDLSEPHPSNTVRETLPLTFLHSIIGLFDYYYYLKLNLMIRGIVEWSMMIKFQGIFLSWSGLLFFYFSFKIETLFRIILLIEVSTCLFFKFWKDLLLRDLAWVLLSLTMHWNLPQSLK